MAGRPTILVRRARVRPGLVFIGVFVFPLLGWGFYNSWDQPLLPAAKALMEQTPESVPDAENLFLALLAFPISGEEPAHERGAAALAAYERAVAEGAPAAQSYAESLGRLRARFEPEHVRLCSPGNREGAYACMQAVREQKEALNSLVLLARPLLMRYVELEQYPRYADPRVLSPDGPAPDSNALRVGLLHLSVLAWMAQDGRMPEAVDQLARSAAIWRRVLAARDAALIDRLIASRLLTAHTLLASEFIRALPTLDGPQAAALETLLTPLSPDERSLAGAFAKEFQVQARVWGEIADGTSPSVRKDFPDTSAWWYRLLVKRNDSIHRSYRDHEALLELERAGCVKIREQVARAAAQPEPEGLPWYEYFYNPIGRVLHSMTGGNSQQVEYLGRQCNLLALQRMVGLQLELRRTGATHQTTAAQVQSLAPRYSDPNTGGPFSYDAASHALGFAFIGATPEFVTPLPLGTP